MSDHNITFYVNNYNYDECNKNDLVFNQIFNRMLVLCQIHLIVFRKEIFHIMQ